MDSEKLNSELTRLRNLQSDARRNEIFGGLSAAEKHDYEARAKRIRHLEKELEAIAGQRSKPPQSEGRKTPKSNSQKNRK